MELLTGIALLIEVLEICTGESPGNNRRSMTITSLRKEKKKEAEWCTGGERPDDGGSPALDVAEHLLHQAGVLGSRSTIHLGDRGFRIGHGAENVAYRKKGVKLRERGRG